MTDIFYPESLSQMRAAIYSWARAEVSPSTPVVWMPQNAPSPVNPYVALSLFVPPVSIGGPWTANPGHAIVVRTVAPLTAYTITVGSTPYVYTSDASTSATEIRDGLLAALVLGGEIASEMIGFAGNALLLESDEVVTVDANLRLKIPQQTISDAVATLAVDVYSRITPGVLSGSLEIAAQLELSLATDGAEEILAAGGWGVRTIEGRRNADIVMNAKIEDRAGFDVRLGCKARQVRAIDWIESVSPTGIVGALSA